VGPKCLVGDAMGRGGGGRAGCALASLWWPPARALPCRPATGCAQRLDVLSVRSPSSCVFCRWSLATGGSKSSCRGPPCLLPP
jgi:hypothetical protein